ncbi:MAG: META domain-containing protein [Anaerolineales bacterium]|nr:META domain-containing protein [Anaerolineales bacterium]
MKKYTPKHIAFYILTGLVILAFALTACSSPDGEGTPAATEQGQSGDLVPTQDGPMPVEPGLPAEVLNMTWYWTALIEQNPASQSVVPDPQNYTIIFNEDGTVNVKADCNQAQGTYSTETGGLMIALGPTTMVFCGEESLDTQYLELLNGVAGGGPDGAGGLALETAGGAQRMEFKDSAPAVQPPTEPEATPIAGDPAQALGEPDGIDTFDNENNWTLFDNDCFSSNITGGWFVMTAKGQTAACWERTWPQVEDAYIQVLLEMPESCAANDRFGLTFRMPDNDRAYMFGLFCDGRYSLTSWDGNATNVIVEPAANDAIIVGSKEDNRIGVLAQGDTFGLYVNGQLLTEVTDSQFQDAGFLGFFVRASEEDNGFVVKYDNLAVWVLPR